MAPPHKPNPAPALTGGGARKEGWPRRPNRTISLDNDSHLVAQLETARANLDRRTNELGRLCDWLDDLQPRQWRAEIQFELIGLDPDEQERLTAEVRSFCRVCRALSWPARRAVA